MNKPMYIFGIPCGILTGSCYNLFQAKQNYDKIQNNKKNTKIYNYEIISANYYMDKYLQGQDIVVEVHPIYIFNKKIICWFNQY